ncbi:HlyD family secretion protein [Candidatus Magnetominusculus xianensis]|uniref:Secretion protein n=1 Tax=Candidatus Magnetominusculus xianensis TaxID=1748249 RepID=A0ABR5SGY4_9BACT|nr:HlyD family secretion protein [Candidatus Magnetominusculus xianensis]KWT86748.1 secretion protein [Candidatus Magnetominusculus xianensis]MBF0402533.1 HlyD family secretion protein [Nitrospirota bacterium]
MENNSNNHKKKIAIAVFVVVIIIGAFITLSYFKYMAVHISTDDAFVEGSIYSVSAKVAGTVKAVYVKDNQFVKEGELLAELDPSDFAIRVKEAEAALSAETSRLNEAGSRLEAASRALNEFHAKTAAAKANVELANANLAQALLDLKRAESLFKNDAISKEKLEKAQTNYNVHTAAKKSAQEQLKQVELSIITQGSVIKQADSMRVSQLAAIKQKEAMLEAANLNIGYTKIYAASSGNVSKKSVEVGNRIQAGQPLMAIVALDDLWVVANYKETQLSKIRPGQRVEIKVDAYPGRILSAKVDSIMSGTGTVFSLFPPENASGHYVKVVQRIPVKIVLDNTTEKANVLRVGMSVVPTVFVE